MKNYLKKRDIDPEKFPEFPPKRLFNKGRHFTMKRIAKINAYFQELYRMHPEKVAFTNAIVDLC